MSALSRSELVAIFRRLADVIEVDEPTLPQPTEVPKPMTALDFQQAFNYLRATNYPKLVEDGAHGPVTTFALKVLPGHGRDPRYGRDRRSHRRDPAEECPLSIEANPS